MTALSTRGKTVGRGPRREHLGILLLLCAGICIYGSWVPFHFVHKPLPQALADFSQINFLALSLGSRSDWAANILLFLPVGFLGMGVFRVDRDGSGHDWILWVLLVTALGCAASVLLEFSQEWFPGRVPSPNDIGAQTIGALLGGAAWTVGGQQVIDWARGWSAKSDAGLRLNNVLLLAVAAHVLSLALPLDLTIRPSDLWHKYQADQIRFVPFQDLVSQTSEAWLELAILIAGSALAGWLLVRLQSTSERNRGRLRLQLIFGSIAFCSILELMQLLVYSRLCKVDDVILGSLGFVAGGLLLPGATPEDGTHAPERLRFRKQVFLAIYVAWLLLFYWWPWDFTWNPESWLQRGQDSFQLPFAVLCAGSYAHASAEILRKTSLFAAVAILANAMLEARRFGGLSRRSLLLATWGGCLLLGILIELGQVALPSRTAGLTDIFLYGMGAGCGTLLAAYLRGSQACGAEGPSASARSEATRAKI